MPVRILTVANTAISKTLCLTLTSNTVDHNGEKKGGVRANYQKGPNKADSVHPKMGHQRRGKPGEMGKYRGCVGGRGSRKKMVRAGGGGG